MRFELEGQTYEVGDVEFIVWGSEPTRFMLGKNIADGSGAPDVDVQWVMTAQVQELVGRTFNLMDDQLNPLVQLRPSEEVGVQPTALQYAESTFEITISQIADGYVEGTFSGANLSHVDDDESIPIRYVATKGQFRAKLVIQE